MKKSATTRPISGRAPTAAGGFTLIEVVLTISLIAVASISFGQALATVSRARLRTELSRDVVVWHHNYSVGLAKGEGAPAATSSTAPLTQSFLLSNGQTVTVVDTFSTLDPSLPSLLSITSTATWSLVNAGEVASSTIVVVRPLPAATL